MNTVIRPTAFFAMPVRVKPQVSVRFGGDWGSNGEETAKPNQPNGVKPVKQVSPLRASLLMIAGVVSAVLGISVVLGGIVSQVQTAHCESRLKQFAQQGKPGTLKCRDMEITISED